MAMAFTEKTPPPFDRKLDVYSKWEKKFELWQSITDVAPTKQGGLLILRLDEETQSAILNEVTIEQIKAAEGVDTILTKLKAMFPVDETLSAYEAYEEFEKYRRPPNVSMPDYCREFQQKYAKVKKTDTTLAEHVLAYRLLNSANLNETQEQIVKATIPAMTSEAMITQLKKINNFSSTDGSGGIKIKAEPTDMIEQETMYGGAYNRSRSSGFHQSDRNRSRYGQGNTYNHQSDKRLAKYQTERKGGKSKPKRGKNPLDSSGNITRCRNCDSINHWEEDCPDLYKEEHSTYQEDCLEDTDDDGIIEVDVASVAEPECFNDITKVVLTCETMSAAVLDSGAPKSVCGNVWLDEYISTLNNEDKKKIVYRSSKNIFKFGCGSKLSAVKHIAVPALIGKKEVIIKADVIKGDLPLLLGRDSLKEARSSLDFRDDTIEILDQKLNLVVTKSGHYALPLGILEKQTIIGLDESEKKTVRRREDGDTNASSREKPVRRVHFTDEEEYEQTERMETNIQPDLDSDAVTPEINDEVNLGEDQSTEHLGVQEEENNVSNNVSTREESLETIKAAVEDSESEKDHDSKSDDDSERINSNDEHSDTGTHTSRDNVAVEVVKKKRGRPRKALESQSEVDDNKVVLKPGLNVRYKLKDSDEWIVTKLDSRAGVKGGVHGKCWNTIDEVTDLRRVMDFDTEVGEYEVVMSPTLKVSDNTVTTEVLLAESYTPEYEHRAMMKELESINNTSEEINCIIDENQAEGRYKLMQHVQNDVSRRSFHIPLEPSRSQNCTATIDHSYVTESLDTFSEAKVDNELQHTRNKKPIGCDGRKSYSNVNKQRLIDKVRRAGKGNTHNTNYGHNNKKRRRLTLLQRDFKQRDNNSRKGRVIYKKLQMKKRVRCKKTQIKKKKKSVRYKKLQEQRVKRSISSVEFKSKIGTKMLWRGKKEWKEERREESGMVNHIRKVWTVTYMRN